MIIIINIHNSSEKPRKFFRYRMTKRTTSLNHLAKSSDPEKVSSNSETFEIFYEFLGDK